MTPKTLARSLGTLIALAAPAAYAQSGGPDAYGYTYAPTTYGYTSLAATGTATGLADENAVNVALPFLFPFYGNYYANVSISDNGALRFGNSSTPLATGYGQTCLPTVLSTGTWPDVAVFWDDFDPGTTGAGEVYYRNDTLNGRFIVSWEGVPIWQELANGTVSFQAHLYPSGVIDLHWSDIYFSASSTHNYGASATIGIQDHVGAQTSAYTLQRSCSTSALSAVTATRFSACTDTDLDGYQPTFCGGTDCNDANALQYPGALESCDGLDTNCDGTLPGSEADADLDGWAICAGDCSDSQNARYPGNPEVCDGLDNDCNGSADFDATLELDFDFDGVPGCDGDCDDGNPAVFPGQIEICDGLDADCNGTSATYETPTPTFTATYYDWMRGNIVLASEDTTLTEIQAFLQPQGDLSITWVAYESTDGLNFTLIDSQGTSATAQVASAWWSSGPMAVQMVAGRYYMLGAHWTGASATYSLHGSTVYPLDVGWGSLVAGTGWDADAAVATSRAFTNFGNTYTFRYSHELEADADGDLWFSCEECDDTNPNVNPGEVEVCDGLDTDCSGSVPGSEADADFDGVPLCSGDCNDAQAAIYPGAVEVCDGLDNDCNAIVPPSEVGDTDADGWFGCTDCDNFDAAIQPGAAEICDGADNDCDGAELVGGTFGLVSGSDTTTTGTSRFRGNIVQITSDAILTSIEANLGIASGSTLTWAVYRSTTQGGTYQLVNSSVNTAAGSSVASWRSSGVMSVPLTPGWFYAIGVHWVASASYSYDTVPPFPSTTALGPIVAGAGYGSATALSSSTMTTSGGYLVRFATQEEVDSDGDGAASCVDCDDGDPARAPGATELCDGIDGDCDGALLVDEVDGDLDGYFLCSGDCNDALPTAYPGAFELCNAYDDDCNGTTPPTELDLDGDAAAPCDGDCDDTNAARAPTLTEVCDGIDNDCDGAPDADAAGETDADADGQRSCGGDCNDAVATVFTGATETCDGFDSDCDGAADFDAAGEVDLDFDGARSCEDCDDNQPVSFPGNAEVCDGFDNDCAGGANFGGGSEGDADSDGVLACFDCDDTQAAVHAGHREECDGLDNDCDVSTDELADLDGDGANLCDGDCDHTRATVGPGLPEACDSMDTDCDEATNESVDGDGDGLSACGGDCDDRDAAVLPGVDEVCDGLDTNCNGDVPDDEVDGDSDGYAPCQGDCDDGAAAVHPDAPEDCDGIDNNCADGIEDENVDQDGDGESPCQGDCDDTDDTFNSDADEVCDGLDNDCDAEIPEGELDADGDGYLACADDCDDALPEVNPGATEADETSCDDNLDNDCDGDEDGGDADCDEFGGSGDDDDDGGLGGSGSCGCESRAGSEGASALGALIGLVGLRRRRQKE